MSRHRRLPALRRAAAVVAAAVAAAFAVASTTAAQEPARPDDRFVGTWQGTLRVPSGVALRLVLEVRRDSAGALGGSALSPDQGNARIPATIAVRGDTIVATMPLASASFTGAISAARDSLRGTFTQGGSLPLALGRVASVAAAAAPPRRPQEPTPPFPYRTLDVTFPSAPNVTLSGTLTLPEGRGPFPAAVLVSGSGPQDRDEALMGHRPFLVLADHLARRGIATLRYDDRGVGRSTGDFARASTVDFAADAAAAVRYLRDHDEIARDRVGIVGHSEGGIVGPMVAADTGVGRGRDVAFLVLLAGPGLPGDSILVLQNRLIAAASGVPRAEIDRTVAVNARLFAAVKGARDSADAVERLRAAGSVAVAALPAEQRAAAEAAMRQAAQTLVSPWMRHFLAHDPRPTLRRVRVPVLALNGTRDLQVPYRENLAAIEDALRAGRNRDGRTVALPGLNHLFQTALTGAPAEYQTIEETFAPVALETISDWIARRFVRR